MIHYSEIKEALYCIKNYQILRILNYIYFFKQILNYILIKNYILYLIICKYIYIYMQYKYFSLNWVDHTILGQADDEL